MNKILVMLTLYLLTSHSAYAGNAFALTQDVLKELSESRELYGTALAIERMRHLDKDTSHADQGTYEILLGRYDFPNDKKCVLVIFRDGKIRSTEECQ